EPILDERGLDLVDPELIEALDSSARVGRLLEHDLIAAALTSALVRLLRVRDQRLETLGHRPGLGDADRAGHGKRVVADLEDMVGDPLQHVLGPRLDVAQRAALEQYREHVAAEASAKIPRAQRSAEDLGDAGEQILARERADLGGDVAELVRTDVRERAHA